MPAVWIVLCLFSLLLLTGPSPPPVFTVFAPEALAAPPKKPPKSKVYKQKKQSVAKTGVTVGKCTKKTSRNVSTKKPKAKAQGFYGKKAKVSAATKKKLKNVSEKTAGRNVATQPLAREFNVQAYGGWGKAAKNDGFTGTPRQKVLLPGAKIDRYGHGGGHFASPKGTSFDKRSLPTGSERLPYTVYEVKKPIQVLSGSVAPAFGKQGLGVQYKFAKSIDTLVKEGYLSPVK